MSRKWRQLAEIAQWKSWKQEENGNQDMGHYKTSLLDFIKGQLSSVLKRDYGSASFQDLWRLWGGRLRVGPTNCISKCLVMLVLLCGRESPDLVQPRPHPRWTVNAWHTALTAPQETVLTMKNQVCFQTKMPDYIHQQEKESQLNSVFKLTPTF